MDKFRSRTGTFLLAVLAGISIGIGCVIYMIQENVVIGPSLLSVGLITVLVSRWNLFTGKMAYVSYRDPQKVLWPILTWPGNLLRTLLLSVVMSVTCQGTKLYGKTVHLAETRLGGDLLGPFILGIFCGLLMYMTVEGYRSNPHPVGEYLRIIFSVMAFIPSGFEHCVADVFYFWMVGALRDGLLNLVVITPGNVVGGAGYAALHRLSGQLTEEPEPARAE